VILRPKRSYPAQQRDEPPVWPHHHRTVAWDERPGRPHRPADDAILRTVSRSIRLKPPTVPMRMASGLVESQSGECCAMLAVLAVHALRRGGNAAVTGIGWSWATASNVRRSKT